MKIPIKNKSVLIIIKALITLALLVVLIKYIKPENLKASLRDADTKYILLAFLLMPVNIILQTFRWRLLVSSEIPGISFTRYLFSLLGGFVFGIITPGRMGEIGRVFLLQVPSRLRLAALHILDKLVFVGFITLIGPLTLYLMPGFKEALPEQARTGIGIVVSILPLLYVFLLVDLRPLKSILLGIQLSFPGKTRFLEFLRAYDGLKPRHGFIAFTLTLTQFFIILTQFYYTSLAFQPVKWYQAAHTYSAVLFVKSVLPISLGSLGVGEWASVSFYQRYNLAEETAFSASLLLFGMNVLIPSLVGLVILLKEKTININAAPQNRSEAA